MPNPYLTPETRIGTSQVTTEELAYPIVRYVWAKFFAVVLAGSLVSSIVIWWNAFSTGGLYGGESVVLSQFGNCFFLTLGAILGIIGSLLPGVIFLLISDSYRGSGLRTWIISLVVSAIMSPLCAVFIVTILSMTVFFTIPDEWFRTLFDVSDVIAE